MRLALIPAAEQARHEMQDVRKYARWHANSRSDNRTYLLCVATKRLRIRAEEQQQETRQDGDASEYREVASDRRRDEGAAKGRPRSR